MNTRYPCPGKAIRRSRSRSCVSQRLYLSAAILLLLSSSAVSAGAFIFSDSEVDLVTHPPGYSGAGGVVTVRVCIDPASKNAQLMEYPVMNNIAVYNDLVPTTGNIKRGSNNDIPSGHIDFESVSLHEIGHCLGLAHSNLATESGLSGTDQNYTRSTTGANGSYDLDAGPDGIRGSSDDVRGDDENLFWFRKQNNDPFTIDTVVDATTYSRDIVDLPVGHAFPANPDRALSTALGYTKTEGVMQQGTFYDEAQRALGHDDVATLRYAGSGVDEYESGGPAGRYARDNYAIVLEYGGISDVGCDINMTFTDTSNLAFCMAGGAYVSGSSGHATVTFADIEFGNAYNWYFSSANDAPVIDAVIDQYLTEGDIVDVLVTANDPDGDALSFSTSGLPDYANLIDHGDGTATLSITPGLGDAGQSNVTITVSDDGAPVRSDQLAFLIDVSVLDSDGDGLSDFDEINVYGTLPGVADTDDDQLSDYEELMVYGTSPFESDSDGDGIGDSVEVSNGADPMDDTSWPVLADGDVAPLGAPDGVVDAADLLVTRRIVLGELVAGPLELSHGDLYPAGSPDGVINLSDLILLHKLVLD